MSGPVYDGDDQGFRAQLEHYWCDGCGKYVSATGILPANPPHFGQYRCPEGHFLDWMPKPRTKAEHKKRRRHMPTVPIGEDYCERCLVDAITAISLGLEMQWSHRRPRAALIDIGLPADNRDELERLCSECHAKQERDRESRARVVNLLRAAGAITSEPTGIERPIK